MGKLYRALVRRTVDGAIEIEAESELAAEQEAERMLENDSPLIEWYEPGNAVLEIEEA